MGMGEFGEDSLRLRPRYPLHESRLLDSIGQVTEFSFRGFKRLGLSWEQEAEGERCCDFPPGNLQRISHTPLGVITPWPDTRRAVSVHNKMWLLKGPGCRWTNSMTSEHLLDRYFSSASISLWELYILILYNHYSLDLGSNAVTHRGLISCTHPKREQSVLSRDFVIEVHVPTLNRLYFTHCFSFSSARMVYGILHCTTSENPCISRFETADTFEEVSSIERKAHCAYGDGYCYWQGWVYRALVFQG